MNGWQAIQAIRGGKIVRCVKTNCYYWQHAANFRLSHEPGGTTASYVVNASSSLFRPDTTFEIYEPEPSELDKAIVYLAHHCQTEIEQENALKAFADAIIAEAKK